VSFDPRLMSYVQAKRLLEHPPKFVKAGRLNRIRQRIRIGEGRIAWRNTVAAFAALAQFDQQDRNQKREERVRPVHIGILASKPGLDAYGKETLVVLSERRREHWPEPRPIPSHNVTQAQGVLGRMRARLGL